MNETGDLVLSKQKGKDRYSVIPYVDFKTS